MSNKPLDISVEEQVGFFLPILESFLVNLTAAYSQSFKKDFSGAEWSIILDQQKSGKFLNHHFLSESWNDFENYLRKKTRLFCFIEEKKKGLVESNYRFWVFFSPTVAAEYFKVEPEKPRDFNPQNIQAVPFPDLLPPFKEAIEKTLSIDLTSSTQVLEKVAELIKISDYYLPEQELGEFDEFVKKTVASLLGREIEQLKNDINNPAVSQGLLKKRLRISLIICWRYFRARNELETDYFKKMIAEENEERIKGLTLASKKIADFSSGTGG